MRSFCFIITFHNFATLENRLTYQCPSSWPVVITMRKELAGTWKKSTGYWPVQMNGNKFAIGQTLKKLVEVVKGRILAGGAQKSPVTLLDYETLSFRGVIRPRNLPRLPSWPRWEGHGQLALPYTEALAGDRQRYGGRNGGDQRPACFQTETKKASKDAKMQGWMQPA